MRVGLTTPVRLSFLARPALAALLAVACGSDDRAAPAPVPEFDGDCASLVTVPTFGELETGILSKCVNCHSSALSGEARHGAPEAVNLDTYEDVQASIVVSYPMIQQRRMPYPDGQGVTDEERNQFYEWARCGTPR